MTDPIIGSLLMGWETLYGYLSQHVLTCLVPAFFIAGGIAAFSSPGGSPHSSTKKQF